MIKRHTTGNNIGTKFLSDKLLYQCINYMSVEQTLDY